MAPPVQAAIKGEGALTPPRRNKQGGISLLIFCARWLRTDDSAEAIQGFIEEVAEVPCRTCRFHRFRTSIYPMTTCRICRRSPKLKPVIDGPSAELCVATVVKNVAVDYLKKAEGRALKNGQVIETKGKTSWGIHPRSNEPKAVSGFRRKCPIFNCLRFKQIARPCCNLWTLVESVGFRQLHFYLQQELLAEDNVPAQRVSS